VVIGVVRYVWNRLSSSGSTQKAGVTPATRERAGTQDAIEKASAEDQIWIYFGSQSGTAQGFSEEIEQDAQAKGMKTNVVDLEEFDADVFVLHKTVILMLATYGEGDPTDNSIEFFQWLQNKDLAGDACAGMKFTVFGLGNRQYVNFNSCGKIADERLETLGATRIYDRGEGDDDQNIQEDFEQWTGNGFWEKLDEASGGAGGAGVDAPEQLQGAVLVAKEQAMAALPLEMVFLEDEAVPANISEPGGTDVVGKWYFHAIECPVVHCEELRQKPDVASGLTTKHIDIAVPSGTEWTTADNLEILPTNPASDVDFFADRFGVLDKLDVNIAFTQASGVDKMGRQPFPVPCTLRTALTLYCDLGGPPSRAAARKLAALADDPIERDVLTSLIQDDHTYHWLTGDNVYLSLREFFELFLPRSHVDLSAFLQLCPRQKNRPYTISSSSKEDPSRIGVCVSVVQEEMSTLSDMLKELKSHSIQAPGASACLERCSRAGNPARTLRGCCSTFLCTRVSLGDNLQIFVRASSFRLPKQLDRPIVMIGAGTGIAPFRAFLREFCAENAARKKTILFFGCCHEDGDFVYRDEIKETLALDPPPLKELVTAFSRDQSHKIYVQDKLRERSKDVVEMYREGAYFFVCGSKKMGQAIRDTLAEALKGVDGADVHKMGLDGRLVEELW